MIYANLDENNICIAISDTGSSKLNSPRAILLQSFNENIIGKKYNNGEWEEVLQPEPESTQLDRIEELLNKNYAQAQQDAVDAYTLELLEGGVI